MTIGADSSFGDTIKNETDVLPNFDEYKQVLKSPRGFQIV